MKKQIKRSSFTVSMLVGFMSGWTLAADAPAKTNSSSTKTNALESCLRRMLVQDVTEQSLGTLFNLRTNAPNAEIQATVARACGAGLLYLGKNDTYGKTVRTKIPEVTTFERSLLSPCETCGQQAPAARQQGGQPPSRTPQTKGWASPGKFTEDDPFAAGDENQDDKSQGGGNTKAGEITETCQKCVGSGRCSVNNCQGGRVAALSFDNRGGGGSYACSSCKGTGKCSDCKGVGKVTRICPKCKGQGGVFMATTALAQHKKEVERAIDAFDAIRQASIAKAKEQEAVAMREESERKRKAAEEEYEAKLRQTKIDATREAMVAEGKAKGEERARQEAKREQEEIARKQKAAEEAKYAEMDQQFLKSIVIIKGNRGSGTGFLCEFKGKKVLLSNAHVLCGNSLASSNPLQLRTAVDGKDIKYKRIRVHKERDIVAYELEKTDNLHFLKIRPNEGEHNNQEEVAVFGNSSGGGVATTLRGKMQGIGPDTIEVNAQFVPGNSGSPIIAYPYQSVVGIATYATRDPQIDWTTRGTRFAEVRRFGVRIDNTEWSDFVDVDTEEYAHALEAFDAIVDFAHEELVKAESLGRFYRATGDSKTKAEKLLKQYQGTPLWMRKYSPDDPKKAVYVCEFILGLHQ